MFVLLFPLLLIWLFYMGLTNNGKDRLLLAPRVVDAETLHEILDAEDNIVGYMTIAQFEKFNKST